MNRYTIFENRIPQHILIFIDDGIYPPWPTFERPMSDFLDSVENKYSFKQETVRKDCAASIF